MLLRKIALVLLCLAALGLQGCATSSGFSPMASAYDSDSNDHAGGGGGGE